GRNDGRSEGHRTEDGGPRSQRTAKRRHALRVRSIVLCPPSSVLCGSSVMSATIKCECGKANLIPDSREGQQLSCIRCSRELEPPRFLRPRPQAGGAYDLLAPPADDPRLAEE